MCARTHVCTCVCARARMYVRVCVCVRVRELVRVRVRDCVRLCTRARACILFARAHTHHRASRVSFEAVKEDALVAEDTLKCVSTYQPIGVYSI